MRTTDRLKFDCAYCVLEFCRRFPDPTPAGTAAVVSLQRLLDQVKALLEQQLFAQQEAASALKEREVIAGPLRERLAHLFRLAAAAAVREREDALRLGAPFSAARQGDLLSFARAAVARATANRPTLLRYGMSPGLLEELGHDLDRYLEAQKRRANASATCVAASADIANLAAETLRIIHHVDALNRIRLAADPERLAQWVAARTVRWRRPRDAAARPAGPDTASVP